jgi:hypothetical protein
VGWAGRTLSDRLLPGFAIARFFPVPEKPAHPPGVQRSTWLCPANAGVLAQGKESLKKQLNSALLTETRWSAYSFILNFYQLLAHSPFSTIHSPLIPACTKHPIASGREKKQLQLSGIPNLTVLA